MDLIKKPAAHVLIIILLGIVAYSGTFHVPFVFDDVGSILESPVIRNPGHFITNPGAYAGHPQRYLSRYVGYISFALNYRYCGLDVRCYHAVNLAIHITNALLIYLFLVMTFRTERLEGSSITGQAGWTALLASAVFVVHPVETQAVTYIVQRLASLATLFYLASLVLFIKARTANAQKGARRIETYGWYIASLVFALLAMKTKEISFTLPLVALLYEFFFFSGRARKRLIFLLPMLLMLLVIPLTEFLDPAGYAVSGTGGINSQADITGWDYLLTQPRVIVTYIRLLLLPVNQNIDYDHPVLHSLLDLRVMGSLVIILCVLLAALWMYRRAGKGHDPVYLFASFGILWFFVTLSVESSVIPIKDIMFEHRLYLPSIGICMTAACLCAMTKRRWFAVSVAVLLLALTCHRNTVWTSELSIWQDALRKSPGKARPHLSVGNAFAGLGQTDKAIAEDRAAINISPNYADAHYNLGLQYSRKGWVDKAIDEYRTALEINPDFAYAKDNLGRLLDNSVENLRHAIKSDPDNATAYYNLGHALVIKGDLDEAVRQLEAASRLKPEDPEIRNELGVAYASAGKLDRALKEFEEAVRLRPEGAGFRNNLDKAVKLRGKPTNLR